MSEDLTQNLPQASFEERVLNALSAIQGDIAALDTRLSGVEMRLTTLETRLAVLEEKVDRRLQETRPIWESVQAQIRQLDRKFDVVLRDLYEVRSDQMSINRRVDQFEQERRQ